jgi:hypothetical protein
MNTDHPTATQASAAGKLVPHSEMFLNDWLEYVETLPWKQGFLDESGYNAFLKAAGNGVEGDVALKEVASRIAKAGDSPDSAKLKSQLRRAYDHVKENPGEFGDVVLAPKAEYAPDKLKKIAAKITGIDEAWLAKRSKTPPDQVSTEQFLNALYTPGEKVVLFNNYKSQGQQLYEVNPESKIEEPLRGGPEGVWFLNNPVDGLEHPNPDQENKLSRRSKESITSWRYMIIESDVTDPKEWLPCVVQLPLRIAAIYTSGGKSIHALVRIDASSKADWDTTCRKMKPILVTLGADAGALTAVRLTRLPRTKRENKNQMQRLLYINPNPEAKPIADMPAIEGQTVITPPKEPHA